MLWKLSFLGKVAELSGEQWNKALVMSTAKLGLSAVQAKHKYRGWESSSRAGARTLKYLLAYNIGWTCRDTKFSRRPVFSSCSEGFGDREGKVSWGPDFAEAVLENFFVLKGAQSWLALQALVEKDAVLIGKGLAHFHCRLNSILVHFGRLLKS